MKIITTLNNSVEFNSVQLNSAKFQTYVTQTKSIVDTYNLKTERGIVLAFDIAIQNWSTNGDLVEYISESYKLSDKYFASDKLKLEIIQMDSRLMEIEFLLKEQL